MSARIKEDTIDMITVFANPPTNSILEPSPVTIGKNANTVVAVAAVNGATKCLTLALIASLGLSAKDLLCL